MELCAINAGDFKSKSSKNFRQLLSFTDASRRDNRYDSGLLINAQMLQFRQYDARLRSNATAGGLTSPVKGLQNDATGGRIDEPSFCAR